MHIEGDIFEISERVKDIDPLLSLSFNREKGKYELTRRGSHVMFINKGELDARVLLKLRKNDLTRRRLEDFIYELEKSEDEAERRRARHLRNQVESVALDHYDRIVGIPHFALGGI